MLNVVIVALILVNVGIEYHLAVYRRFGNLPFSMGIELFMYLNTASYVVSFIWMLGFWAGVVAAVLAQFGILHSAVLWPVSVPALISGKGFERPSRGLLICYTYSVLALPVLTIANFYVSSYRSLWEQLGPNYGRVGLIALGILVVGNLLRMAVLSWVQKRYSGNAVPGEF